MVRKKKYYSYKGERGKIAPNVLQRDFSTTAVNQKWATDICEFSISGQKKYFSPIMDLYTQEIISFTISDSPNLLMVTDMLKRAFKVLPDNVELIIHSDQGWHYQHLTYQEMLKGRGIIQSMSRKGNCLDNAVIENFFGILKSELVYLQKFESMQQFIRELNEYIEYYNNSRIKIKLKGMSPVQFRKHSI
jgi:transposase InsO family protein